MASPVFPIYKKGASLIFLFLFSCCAFSQPTDTTKRIITFNGSASITNNGFSLIPAFSLGYPAAIVVLYAGGKRLSFEPEFRYSLEGRPWSFIFIWRYKLIKKDRFQLSLGTHLPALNFVSNAAIINGVEHDAIRARRFFPVFELFPNHYIKKDISLGLYYQYAYGIEKDLAKHTHFTSLRTNFSNIRIQGKYYLKLNPQLYYLRMDRRDGFYATAGLSLARKNFPISISSLMNKAINTDIPGNNFDWNISVVYSINNSFIRL